MQKVKKILLVIQGEGRGHMTQAISMYDLLISKGHHVCAVVLGSSGNRDLPDFFYQKIKTEIVLLTSPNFVPDKNNKGIRIGPSIIHSIMRLGVYRKSIRELKALVEKHEPDLIVNFFDILAGLYYKFNRPKIPMVCVAHQYIYLHKDFVFPKGHLMDKMMIKFFTRLTSSNATKRIALSFYHLNNRDTNTNVVVTPPLLRNEVFELIPQKNEFFLIYLVNNGYYQDVLKWHKAHPEVELHCFTDMSKLNVTEKHEKLFLHQLDDKKFLEMMASSKGLVTTAGFEAVCEAMYLGKPVLMVPIEGHYEQFCNSRDAYKAGAGIFDDKFDIDKLISYTVFFQYENTNFKQWVNKARNQIYQELCEVMN